MPYFSLLFPEHPALVTLQNTLRRMLPEGAVYSDPATFHLTLAQIDEARDANLSEMTVPDIPAFGIGGAFIEVFPAPEGQPNPVVLSISAGRALYALQNALYYNAEGAGAKVSLYSMPALFRPHITLAYADLLQGDSASRYLWGSGAEDVHLEVRSFALQEEGYVTVRAWDLRETVEVIEQQDEVEMPALETTEVETPVPVLSEMTVAELSVPIHYGEAADRIGDRQRVRMSCVVEMRGVYPDVPTPADVTVEAGDVFAILPVGAFNARSRNERTYSESAMRAMMEQINQRRPTGMWGHLSENEMGTRFDPPAVRWLAAVERGGVIYAKARALTQEAREFFIGAKKDNATVGTSLFAWIDSDGETVTDMDLITIDLADPARVGVPLTAAKPVITNEMSDTVSQPPVIEEREAPMENVTLETVQSERDALRAANDTLTTELATARTALAALSQMLKTEQVVPAVEQLLETNLGLVDMAVTAVVAEKVGVASARTVVARLVRNEKPRTQAEITSATEKVLAQDDIKTLIRSMLEAEMGPKHRPSLNAKGPSDFGMNIPNSGK